MTRYLHKAGFIVAASIPIFVLPARIAEGQLNDPVNLVGSEIVIFLMSLTCWYAIFFIQKKVTYPVVIKLLLSVLICCILSNLFYFIFNPFFKDFPFRTSESVLYIKILMLSSRGVLMSIILIPAVYYLKRDSEARKARQENQRLVMEKIKIEKALLEQTVFERTGALRDTLSFLQKSQEDLEYQFYIQSRLVASITHDIAGPFKFLIQVSNEITRLAANNNDEIIKVYTNELNQALGNMFTFVSHLLEFTKLPLKEKVSKLETVSISKLIGEKSVLFKGIVSANNNEMIVNVDATAVIKSNYNLLGIILHNLIDNANKYTRAGSINLNVSSDHYGLLLTVENSGIAMPLDIVDWLNSDKELTDTDSKNNYNKAQGIGLVLVKEICEILDIGLYVTSDAERTVVSLTFIDESGDNQLVNA